MPQRSALPGSKGQFVGAAERAPSASRAPAKVRKKSTVWDVEARAILRSEMQRRGFTFKRLALALEEQEPPGSADEAVTERQLISRINRGTFPFAFALRCLRAMGADQVSVGPVG